jgi:hypothetical protein
LTGMWCKESAACCGVNLAARVVVVGCGGDADFQNGKRKFFGGTFGWGEARFRLTGEWWKESAACCGVNLVGGILLGAGR